MQTRKAMWLLCSAHIAFAKSHGIVTRVLRGGGVMRFFLILVFAIALSVSGTFFLQQPDVHFRINRWAEKVAHLANGTSQNFGDEVQEQDVPTDRGLGGTVRRPIGNPEQSNPEKSKLDGVFWLNQGLSFFYTMLGVVVSEVVRGFSDRRRKIDV